MTEDEIETMDEPTETEDTEAAEDAPDTDAEDADEEGAETDGEDEDGEEDEDVGRGANKRIRQLNEKYKASESRAKDLAKQLEDAKKLTGDDGKAILSAAEKSGILPGLMSRDEADAFRKLENYPALIEDYEEWIDDHGQGDDYEYSDGSTRSYGEVKARVRALKRDLASLQEQYGDRRKALKTEVKQLFELGLAAKKAGWSPDKKKSVVKKTKPSDTPERTGRPTRMAKRPQEIEVKDDDSLEAFIIARDRMKKGKV